MLILASVECFLWAQTFAVLHLMSRLILMRSYEADILWILISQMKKSRSREVGHFVRSLIPRQAQAQLGFHQHPQHTWQLAVLRLLSAWLCLRQVNGWPNENMKVLTLSSRHLKDMLLNEYALYICMPPKHVFLPSLHHAASWIAM